VLRGRGRGRRLTSATAILSILLLAPVAATAADDLRDHDRTGTSTPDAPDVMAKWGGRGSEAPVVPDPGQVFVGYDGHLYTKAGWTVGGRHGARYLGEELDSACFTGDRLQDDMQRLAQFAKIIRDSGRTVIFTVAPSKSAVYKKDLPRVMPHGSCDTTGIAAQDRILDNFTDPSYLPTRPYLSRLMDSGEPAYWRLDSHWTTVGSTRWGHAVARRLDPAVAASQRYKETERTHIPDIAFVVGNMSIHESEEARATVTKVRSRPTSGSPKYNVEALSGFDLSWTSRPKRGFKPRAKTWPGHTLLLGDSFTYVGMESLIPLFRHGRYMWTGHVDTDDLIDAVAASDPVVIEVAQRYVANSLLAYPSTQAQLALTLARAGRPD
jgi:alginate O-acetyltransferase complex protein AlgJ